MYISFQVFRNLIGQVVFLDKDTYKEELDNESNIPISNEEKVIRDMWNFLA